MGKGSHSSHLCCSTCHMDGFSPHHPGPLPLFWWLWSGWLEKEQQSKMLEGGWAAHLRSLLSLLLQWLLFLLLSRRLLLPLLLLLWLWLWLLLRRLLPLLLVLLLLLLLLPGKHLG